LKVLCHINGDGDILKAWLDWHCQLGVSSFHFIVHGPRNENAVLYELSSSYPIVIEDSYEGEYLSQEKMARTNAVARHMRGEWIISIDSDEFLELPYDSLAETIARLEYTGANALPAPMLQRVRLDGTVGPGGTIEDPFSQFPFCSKGLYRQMGVRADISKYPLFLCSDATLINPGNHKKPDRKKTVLSGACGVTHHFKWRYPVFERLRKRIESTHKYRQESAGYFRYLSENDFRLPLAGAFPYSRSELFHRGLLRRASLWRRTIGFVRRAWNRKSLATRGTTPSSVRNS